MGRKFWPIISIFCLAASGCAGSDTVLRKQVALEGAVEQLTREEKALNARIAELTQALSDLQQRVKGTEGDLDAIRPAFDQLRASHDDLYQRLSSLPAARAPQREPAKAAALPVEPAPSAAPAPEPANEAKAAGQEAYVRAFAVYSQGNLPSAIEAFESFVRAEPASEFAPNALYWAGECYYTQQKYQEALKSFQRVVRDYPKARKVPDAMLKAGFSLVGMGDPARARGELQALVERYPKSPAAAKAKEKLGRL